MFRLPLPVLSLRRRLVSLVRSLLGRAQYRLGALASARHSFERVLELMGDDFVAYVHLGLIARSRGDRAGASREFDNARRTDPERYARLRLPREIDAAALEPLLSWDRSFWSPVPAVPEAPPPGDGQRGDGQRGAGGSSRRRADPWVGDPWAGDPWRPGAEFGGLADADADAGPFPGGLQSAGRPSRGPRGDFRDRAEARRFRDRRPIAHADIANVDFDALARALQGHRPPPEQRGDAAAG